MAKGFMCDACKGLEAGIPPQVLSIKPADATTAQTYELCTNCAASFADWRTDRVPGTPTQRRSYEA
jgi:hypothetical protein